MAVKSFGPAGVFGEAEFGGPLGASCLLSRTVLLLYILHGTCFELTKIENKSRDENFCCLPSWWRCKNQNRTKILKLIREGRLTHIFDLHFMRINTLWH